MRVLAIIVLFGVLFMGCERREQSALEHLTMIEQAIGDEWVQKSLTEITDYHYMNKKKDSVIIYYCCKTVYAEEPELFDGVHTEAISSILDPAQEVDVRNCAVGLYDGIWCSKGDRAYLCWTISPELSCILEYDPQDVGEEAILAMAESVEDAP